MSRVRLLASISSRIDEVQEPPWTVLAPEEREALAGLAEPDVRHATFLRVWTLKEAVLKALGTGLSREPASVAIALDPVAVRVDGVPLPLRFGAGGMLDEASERFVWLAWCSEAACGPNAVVSASHSGLLAANT